MKGQRERKRIFLSAKYCIINYRGILVITKAGRSNSLGCKECLAFAPRDLLCSGYQTQCAPEREPDLRLSHTTTSHNFSGLAGNE